MDRNTEKALGNLNSKEEFEEVQKFVDGKLDFFRKEEALALIAKIKLGYYVRAKGRTEYTGRIIGILEEQVMTQDLLSADKRRVKYTDILEIYTRPEDVPAQKPKEEKVPKK